MNVIDSYIIALNAYSFNASWVDRQGIHPEKLNSQQSSEVLWEVCRGPDIPWSNLWNNGLVKQKPTVVVMCAYA